MEFIDNILKRTAEEEDLIGKLNEELRTHLGRASGFQISLAALKGDESPAVLSLKRKIQDKIDEESGLVDGVKLRLAEAVARKSAFDETVKFLPKTGSGGNLKDLRPSSELFKVREILRAAGKPLTLDEILQKIGRAEGEKRDEKSRRISFRGSLRGYAKDGKFFTIEEAPDTFGLLEFNK
jgi:hypothetical protein